MSNDVPGDVLTSPPPLHTKQSINSPQKRRRRPAALIAEPATHPQHPNGKLPAIKPFERARRGYIARVDVRFQPMESERGKGAVDKCRKLIGALQRDLQVSVVR